MISFQIRTFSPLLLRSETKAGPKGECGPFQGLIIIIIIIIIIILS
jgi:hypothetical protein